MNTASTTKNRTHAAASTCCAHGKPHYEIRALASKRLIASAATIPAALRKAGSRDPDSFILTYIPGAAHVHVF